MALSTAAKIALAGLGLVAAGVGAKAIQEAIRRRRLEQKRAGELPSAELEECLVGTYSSDRVPLPEVVAAQLNDNGRKTADQFYGFHLSPEAIEEAWNAIAGLLAQGKDIEEAWLEVAEGLMPCGWTAVDPVGWPVNWNNYDDAPDTMSPRQARAMRSFTDLWLIAVSNHLDAYLGVDVDPVVTISDPERDTCIKTDVISLRGQSVPTSEGVIVAALAAAGIDAEKLTVDQVMAQLEQEYPRLADLLDADWWVPQATQDAMWQTLIEASSFPKPVSTVVFNVQSQSCPWEEKDGYTLNMANFWYSAKKIAAIAQAAGILVPVIFPEQRP